MRHIRIPLLVVVLSFMVTGMAFALGIPNATTWTSGNGCTVLSPCLGTAVPGNGFGDVLLAPLYDVRNLTDPNLPGAAGTAAHPQATLIAIVNTDDGPTFGGVLARLRFREWKRSFECLNIDIVLTTNDVWVAQVVLGSDNKTPILNQALGQGSRYVPANTLTGLNQLITTNLIPAAPDGLPFKADALETGATIERCQYGYFEVIGEERIGPPNTTFEFHRLGNVAAGVYSPTALVSGAINGPLANTNQTGGGRDVGNVLMGTVYIVRPDVAISHQYNMVPIANFAVASTGIWHSIGAGSTAPTLQSDVQGEGVNKGAGGFDNLEALLSKRIVDFQYAAQGVQGGYDPIDLSQTPVSTSVVITFPTKWAHYCTTSPFNRRTTLAAACSTAASGVRASNDLGAPFTGWRETKGDDALTTAQTPPFDYGEFVTIVVYDRSSHLLITGSCGNECPSGNIQRLPYEVNIIGLKPIDIPSIEYFADFRNNETIPTANAGTEQKFFSGWAEIDLSPDSQGSLDLRNIPQGKFPVLFNLFDHFGNWYRGLPAIGIVMTEFYNGSASGYFGNTVPWQFEVDWRFGATQFGFGID